VIGLLRGQVLRRQPPRLLLAVHGVGYELEAPMSTFYDLPLGDETVTLFTHLIVREDAHVLYGFLREGERDLFREVLKVSGVGGRMALAILSGMGAEEFATCIQAGDSAALTRIPGIGKKSAERLIVELRDRLPGDAVLPGKPAATGSVPDAAMDAVSALIALGYKPAEASRMVKAVQRDGMASDELIREALQAALR
jgi:Holliday junction DNA helicase RuvA